MFGFFSKPVARAKDPRPVEPVLDSATGDAGRDGFTRLSRADRETGYRPPVGADPAPYNFED